MIKKLTHSFIYVLDLESAINFYTNKLGLTIDTNIIVNGDCRNITNALGVL
jgi:catechol 2,3-dioxygenase-like lactoylglutathione lyase family enzyme